MIAGESVRKRHSGAPALPVSLGLAQDWPRVAQSGRANVPNRR